MVAAYRPDHLAGARSIPSRDDSWEAILSTILPARTETRMEWIIAASYLLDYAWTSAFVPSLSLLKRKAQVNSLKVGIGWLGPLFAVLLSVVTSKNLPVSALSHYLSFQLQGGDTWGTIQVQALALTLQLQTQHLLDISVSMPALSSYLVCIFFKAPWGPISFILSS